MALFPFSSSQISAMKLIDALHDKYITRKIYTGGVIEQPAWFTALTIDPYLMRKAKEQCAEPEFVSIEETTSLEAIFADAMNEGTTYSFPFVFKPRNTAEGANIIFFEHENDLIKATFPYVPDESEKFTDYYFTTVPGFLQQRDANTNTFTAYFNSSLDELFAALDRTHRREMLYYDGWVYDPGMVEAYVPSIKPEGRSFESRIKIKGDLSTGKGALDIEESFCRLGASSYYSNYAMRTRAIIYKDPFFMLRPHFTIGEMNELEEKTEHQIHMQFRYLSNRLREAGICIQRGTAVRVDYDLMWRETDTLPVPVLIESDVWGNSDAIYDQTFGIRN